MCVVLDDLQHRASAAGDLQEGDDVAGVLGTTGEDSITWHEIHRIERHVPGPGGIFKHGDLVRPAIDQSGYGRVCGLNLSGGGRGGLISADLSLLTKVADYCLRHLRGGQRGPGIVQVSDVLHARSVASRAVDVETHADTLTRSHTFSTRCPPENSHLPSCEGSVRWLFLSGGALMVLRPWVLQSE